MLFFSCLLYKEESDFVLGFLLLWLKPLKEGPFLCIWAQLITAPGIEKWIFQIAAYDY